MIAVYLFNNGAKMIEARLRFDKETTHPIELVIGTSSCYLDYNGAFTLYRTIGDLLINNMINEIRKQYQ